MRVVSLLPAATEVVYALGVEPVAVSHECDYPPPARDLPAANTARIDPDASSAAVDEQVADAEASGGVYDLSTDVLERVDPDLVITQGVCDVCAVDGTLVREAIEELDLGAEVVTTHPHSLDDVFTDVERVGAALGREERADVLVSDLRERVERVRERVPDGDRPRVAVLDWMDPVMVAGHWIPGMVELAGGAYGMADPGDRSTPREWRAVRDYDPEVLVAAPCGFSLDRALANSGELTDRPGWTDLAATPQEAYVADGHHYFNRPGPRLVDTLEALAATLHPDRFDGPGDAIRAL